MGRCVKIKLYPRNCNFCGNNPIRLPKLGVKFTLFPRN